MSFNFSPRIVRDGLVLYLDAANNKSYTSGSTNWIDLSTGLNNGALQNAPTFNGSNYGNIVFDGINEYASFSTNPNLYFTGTSPYTLSVYANILTSTAIFSGFINRENAFPSPRNGYNMWFYADPTQVAIASERWTGDGVQKLTYILINNRFSYRKQCSYLTNLIKSLKRSNFEKFSRPAFIRRNPHGTKMFMNSFFNSHSRTLLKR